jgi:hypothetical protein
MGLEGRCGRWEKIRVDRSERLDFDDSTGTIVTEPLFGGEGCHAQLQHKILHYKRGMETRSHC